jgi:hypothetical protein
MSDIPNNPQNLADEIEITYNALQSLKNSLSDLEAVQGLTAEIVSLKEQAANIEQAYTDGDTERANRETLALIAVFTEWMSRELSGLLKDAQDWIDSIGPKDPEQPQ